MIVKVIGSGVDDTPAPTNPKRYTALLTQTGINNPTSVILENTPNITVDFTRGNAGGYICNTINLPANKYSIIIGSNYTDTNNAGIIIQLSDTIVIMETVITSNSGGAITKSDNILNNTMRN